MEERLQGLSEQVIFELRLKDYYYVPLNIRNYSKAVFKVM